MPKYDLSNISVFKFYVFGEYYYIFYGRFTDIIYTKNPNVH